jgi:CheY-like chemotaxis protein
MALGKTVYCFGISRPDTAKDAARIGIKIADRSLVRFEKKLPKVGKEFRFDTNANLKLCIARMNRETDDQTDRLSAMEERKLERESAMNIAASRPLEQMTSHMPANLLLIDDNAVQAATRQTILKRAGYFVVAALNPVRALEQIQNGEFPGEIELVITDHLMPGLNGAEFVRALRKTHPRLPVLVISGLEEAEQEYEDLNVTFRMKPLLPDSLLETVGRMVGEGGAASRLPAVS